MTRTSPPPLLFFASLLAFALSVAMLAGCCEAPPPRYPEQVHLGRSVAQQEAAAGDVTVACVDPSNIQIKGGSGVLVTDRRVVTASHVVTCHGETGVYVEFPGGVTVLARVAVLDLEDDLAVLALTQPVVSYYSAVIGPRPDEGDRICFAAGAPKRVRRCGVVTGYRDDDDSNVKGDVETDAEIRAGNSGSGVYDDAGRLVGIVTYYRAIAGVSFGGGFTSLESHAWVAR
jgi:S1-C subfamily serine protease